MNRLDLQCKDIMHFMKCPNFIVVRSCSLLPTQLNPYLYRVEANCIYIIPVHIAVKRRALLCI
jgi:hypothetical protein